MTETKTTTTTKQRQTKNFILSHYSCIGVTKLNNIEYSKNNGRPICYGIEKRLFQSPILQKEEFKSILTSAYDKNNDDGYIDMPKIPLSEDVKPNRSLAHLLTDFKKLHKKQLASNEQVVIEALPPSSPKLQRNDTRKDVELFSYTTVGRSIYSLIEEYQPTTTTTTTTTVNKNNNTTTTSTTMKSTNNKSNINPMIITLQPPKCVNGVARSTHQLNDVSISSYQLGVLKFDKQTMYVEEEEKEFRKDGDDDILENFFETYPKYVVRIANKTGDNMVKISNALYNELSDDFPNRMLQTSKRIIGQFDKTIDRFKKGSDTVIKTADDICRWLTDDDDDDDDMF